MTCAVCNHNSVKHCAFPGRNISRGTGSREKIRKTIAYSAIRSYAIPRKTRWKKYAIFQNPVPPQLDFTDLPVTLRRTTGRLQDHAGHQKHAAAVPPRGTAFCEKFAQRTRNPPRLGHVAGTGRRRGGFPDRTGLPPGIP